MKHPETAKRLSTALNNAGIKAVELAERSGVSKASISQYVNGSHAPSNISSGKMAKVLGVSPVWLMGFDVSMIEEPVELTTSETEFVKKYRKLGERDRSYIDGMIDLMLEREDDENVG